MSDDNTKPVGYDTLEAPLQAIAEFEATKRRPKLHLPFAASSAPGNDATPARAGARRP